MPWHTLDIAPTTDEREIRRAYARQLKRRQHEEDTEFFSRLRRAYETARAWARENSQGEIKEIPGLFFEPARTAPIAKDIPSEEISEKPEEKPEIPESPPETSHLPEARDASPPPKETLEDLLQALERLLEKEEEAPDDDYALFEEGSLFGTQFTLHDEGKSSKSRLATYRRAQLLCMKWEMIRIHPQLENLAEREIFSERLAILLAEYWPQSLILWPQTRDFFAWRIPISSDDSPSGQALRFLFDNADDKESPDFVPVKKTWKDYWQEFLDFFWMVIFLISLYSVFRVFYLR
jgi:hypothetical protein